MVSGGLEGYHYMCYYCYRSIQPDRARLRMPRPIGTHGFAASDAYLAGRLVNIGACALFGGWVKATPDTSSYVANLYGI